MTRTGTSDALSISFVGANGVPRRVRFEEREFDGGHWRIVEHRQDRTWRRVVREPVSNVGHERVNGDEQRTERPSLGVGRTDD